MSGIGSEHRSPLSYDEAEQVAAAILPRWVSNGKMNQAKADEETAVMEAIVADYERQVAGERLL